MTPIKKPSGQTWAKLAYEFRERAEKAEAEVELLRVVLEDFAEYDCEYGDNCPSNAGTRHGTCVGCKARQALEKKP